MVCLYGLTIEAVQKTEDFMTDVNGFYDWNWLVHLLTRFIFQQSVEYTVYKYEEPHIPIKLGFTKNEVSIWNVWFTKVFKSLKKEFFDADKKRTLSVLCNCPAEEVAIIIYDSTPLNMQKTFLSYLKMLYQYNSISYLHF